jgi:hypothetical protein
MGLCRCHNGVEFMMIVSNSAKCQKPIVGRFVGLAFAGLTALACVIGVASCNYSDNAVAKDKTPKPSPSADGQTPAATPNMTPDEVKSGKALEGKKPTIDSTKGTVRTTGPAKEKSKPAETTSIVKQTGTPPFSSNQVQSSASPCVAHPSNGPPFSPSSILPSTSPPGPFFHPDAFGRQQATDAFGRPLDAFGAPGNPSEAPGRPHPARGSADPFGRPLRHRFGRYHFEMSNSSGATCPD